ncbi:hypothetical protein RSAG8_06579, partial [Rhizoctonia solani AG-8 WAC10335]
MPPSQVRSRGGCLACKSKHKKCDETKPNCQRCERSGLKCSGYVFITCDSEGKAVKHWTESRSKLPTRQRATPVHVQTRQRVTEVVSTGSTKGGAKTVGENALGNSCFIMHNSEGGHKDLGFNTTHAFDATPHPSFEFTRPETMIEGYRQDTIRHNAPNDQTSYPADYLPIPRSAVLYTPVVQPSGHSTTQHMFIWRGEITRLLRGMSGMRLMNWSSSGTRSRIAIKIAVERL